MQRLELVKFLAESAVELLESRDAEARIDEAAELMNLGSRILARAEASETIETVQEAA